MRNNIRVLSSPLHPTLELLFANLQLKQGTLAFGLYYRPPADYNSFPQLDSALEDPHSTNFKSVLSLGDFNVNLLTLLEIASKYNLNQVVSEPTRSVGGRSSLIDHVYSSDPSLIDSCCTTAALRSSDHNSLSLSLPWTQPPVKKTRRTFWIYVAADPAAICSDLEHLPLSIFKLNNVDSFWYQWRVFFMSVMFKHIPHKLLQKRPCHGLLRSLNPCVRSETCYSVKPSHQTLTLPGFPFVKPETKLCVPCKLQRKTFYAISLPVHTPRQFRSTYYSLQPNRQRIPTHLTNGHVTAESAQNKCELLNSFFFFVSTFTSNPPVFMQSTPVRNVPSLDSISCSSEDVHQLFTSLPSKTASGPDGISSQMLKMSASSIAPHLSALFNLSLSTGSVPTDWKLSHITPVYKAGDPSLVSNYPSYLPLITAIKSTGAYCPQQTATSITLKFFAIYFPIWFLAIQLHPGGYYLSHH